MGDCTVGPKVLAKARKSEDLCLKGDLMEVHVFLHLQNRLN